MAVVNLNPPVCLLFDYLLASSWAWLALCLATIATTLRALRLHFLRRRLLTLTAQASSHPALPISPSTTASEPQRCCVDDPSISSASPQRSFKRRARSKSTSALEKLPQGNGDGFWVPGVELLSSVFDGDLSSSLKKIAFASKISRGQHGSAETHQRSWLYAEHNALNKSKEGLISLKEFGVPGCRAGLKYQCEDQDEDSTRTLTDDRSCADEETASSSWWFPSWALSLCGPSQFSWPSIFHGSDHGVPPHLISPCFERQFGWDKLLESKFGFPWRFPCDTARRSECTMEGRNVVKVWDGAPKKMLRKLDLDEQSTLALDACVTEGLAYTGNVAGEISLWELERRACARVSASYEGPVLALSRNLDRRTTIVGSAASISFWDQRSPSCNLHCSSLPLMSSALDVKSRGNGLCVASEDGILSLYDLRKLGGGHIVAGRAPELHQNVPMLEVEAKLWDGFIDDTEDEFEDDCGISTGIRAVESHKGFFVQSYCYEDFIHPEYAAVLCFSKGTACVVGDSPLSSYFQGVEDG